MSYDPLVEVKAAQAELHATGTWTTNKDNPATHVYKCDQHLQNAIAALAPPPAPPPPVGTWTNVASQSALLQAIAASKPSQQLRYSGPPLTGEFTVRTVAPGIVVDMNGAKFLGTKSGDQLPAFFVQGAGGIHFMNFDLTSPGGDGLRIEDARPGLKFTGFKIHDTAAQGIHIYGRSRIGEGGVLDGEVTNCGLDLTQDPHAEKGTGLHGFYSGGSPYPVVNGDWNLHVHDQPHGAAMQINRTRNTRIKLRAERITFVAHSQVGGNALQFWSYNETPSVWNDRITVDSVVADGVARVVETSGMESGSLASSSVVVGRGSNVRKTPAYATKAGMRYLDCT